MHPVDIIAKKRDGQELTSQEIEFFINGYTGGDIPDYQASAWTMAVFLRGMTHEETTALTLAMANSGQVLDLTSVFPLVADKHSSGGVGDKTTLVVAPWVAASGVPIGKMSGRGLSHTGGTLDKLESIPGFRVELSGDEFIKQLKEHRIVVSGQTHDLAPADGKLYGLRDVTATVDCIPLIASSIMSKKIAAGAQVIVLDVKAGRGAFMKTEASAVELAQVMVEIGKRVGRRVAAVIGDMSQPLGHAIGNALEVIEAIDTLKGRGPRDFYEHCLTISTQLLLLANIVSDEQRARDRLGAVLESGSALEKFIEWIDAQGGDSRVVNDPGLLPHAQFVEEFPADRSGYVAGIDTLELGMISMRLGGGREKKADPIDHAVGVVLNKKVGEPIRSGETLALIHANDAARAAQAMEQLRMAITLSETPPAPPELIRKIVT